MKPRGRAPARGAGGGPPDPPRSQGASVRGADLRGLICCAVLAACALAAYSRTFSAPFVFDDVVAIADNPTIRHLGDLGAVLSPPSTFIEASGVSSRPLVNLSLALNYAAGGLNPRGYHAVNLAIHICAALLLFGTARRTLASMKGGAGGGRLAAPTATAFCAALLWAVHPLLTESVTCVIQRTESLMALCYLLTLYSFVRYSAQGGCRKAWAALAIACCLLGMAAKEAMVTAPVIVFLYDRSFVSGSLREAWRRHGRLHLALASTWVLLAALIARAGLGSRGIVSGSGAGSQSWSYLLAQCGAIVTYLKLSFWPHPLVVDYGSGLAAGPAMVWRQALLLLVLLLGVGWANIARPAVGFLGAWFFIILAPSSSVVPLFGQTIAEHRMYLPLASLTVLAAVAARRWLGRGAPACCAAVAAALLVATLRRNEVYRSEVGLWSDTAASRPDNPRAHNNLGVALAKMPGRLGDAVEQYEEALRLDPDYAPAHNNLGLALENEPGGLGEAISQFEEALRLVPGFADAHRSLGKALMMEPGRLDEAIAQYEEAIRLLPSDAEARDSLGVALMGVPGRQDEAIAQYREALRLRPEYAEAHNNLGIALAGSPGRLDEALAQYREALRLKPDFAEAHNNLGNALASAPGKLGEAIVQYREALRLLPDFAEAHFDLAVALLRSDCCRQEAEEHLRAGLRLRPQDVRARRILEQVQASPPAR